MNKRIDELAKQATMYYSNGQERSFDKEKFARLIVEECAYHARQCPVVKAIHAEDVAQHIEKHLGRK